MRTTKITGTLYAGILLILFLFPPWTDGYRGTRRDALYSSIGHHWRFSFPDHWGYQEDICTDSVGRTVGCNGKSVWVPDDQAVVNYRMLQYEAALGFVGSLFLTLIVDLMRTPFSHVLSSLLATFKNRSRRTFR